MNASTLPPDLLAFRSAPIPTEDAAKTLDHMARMRRIDLYGRIKHEFGLPLTTEELRHIMILLGAQRAETLRQKRSDAAGAKKASANAAVQAYSLDEL